MDVYGFLIDVLEGPSFETYARPTRKKRGERKRNQEEGLFSHATTYVIGHWLVKNKSVCRTAYM